MIRRRIENAPPLFCPDNPLLAPATTFLGQTHTGRDLRLVNIKRALTLDQYLHHTDLHDDIDRTVDRQGPREQTRLGSALKAAGPGSGRDPHVKLKHGLTSTKKTTTSANDAPHHRVFTGHGPATKSLRKTDGKCSVGPPLGRCLRLQRDGVPEGV